MANGVLIHVRVPQEVLRELDSIAPGEPRGAVVTKALREYLRAVRQLNAVREGRGLIGDPPPYWRTDEDVDEWVRSLREGWDR